MNLDSGWINNIADVRKNEGLSNLSAENDPVQAKDVSTVRQLIDQFDNGMHGSGLKTQERKLSLTEIGIKTLRNGKFSKKKTWWELKIVGWNSPAKNRILSNLSHNVTSKESTPSQAIIHQLKTKPMSVLNQENNGSRNGKLITFFERLAENELHH